MTTFLTTADYFAILSQTVPGILGSTESLRLTKWSDNEHRRMELSSESSICLTCTPEGSQMSIEFKPRGFPFQNTTLFNGAWLDIDAVGAITTPSVEFVFLEEGWMKVNSSRSILQRLRWLLKKGMTLEQAKGFIESFVFSLTNRPKELELETFSPSDSFTLWKTQRQQALLDGERGGSAGELSHFYTLKTTDSAELIIDAVKRQKLAQWKHWEQGVEGEPKCKNMLQSCWEYSPVALDELDMDSGVLSTHLPHLDKVSKEIELFGGIELRKKEVLLARIGSAEF